MRSRRHLSSNQDDNFNVMDMKEIAMMLSGTTQMMTMLLGAVAAVSLVVGGIGIMNIMLVSVTERTREIGTRARSARLVPRAAGASWWLSTPPRVVWLTSPQREWRGGCDRDWRPKLWVIFLILHRFKPIRHREVPMAMFWANAERRA